MKGRVRKTAASPQPQTHRAVREVATRLWLVVDKDKGEGPKEKIAARLKHLGAATDNAEVGFDEVIAACNQAIALEPDFSFSYLMRAAAKTDLGQLSEALADCDRAINLIGTESHKENEASAYVMRAQVFRKLHEFDKALDDCERAIKLRPNDGWPHLVRGLTLQNAGRIDESIDEFTLSWSFYPNEVIINRGDEIWTVPRKEFVESNNPSYTKQAPTSETAEPSAASGMRDDLKKALAGPKAKWAAARNAALAGPKAEWAAARLLANYQVLVRHIDLENPATAPDERLRQAGRLLTAYERLVRAKPDFKDSNPQLTAARRIKQAAHRQRQAATRPGPAPRRGRPPKAAHR